MSVILLLIMLEQMKLLKVEQMELYANLKGVLE